MCQALQTASLTSMFALYLLQVAVGLVALLLFIPPQATGRDFHKTMTTMATVLATIAWILKGIDHAGPAPIFANAGTGLISPCIVNRIWLGFSIGTAGYAMTAILFQRLFVSSILIAIAGAGIVAVILETIAYPPLLFPAAVAWPLGIVHALTASMMGGGFLLNMLFGHWYLVEAGMPLGLLVRAANIMMAVVVARAAVIAGTIPLAATFETTRPVLARMTALHGHGIFFWERIGIGIVIPLVLAFMVRATARIGANQSATGLLYTGVAFAIMGELTARYLFLLTGLPI